MDIRIGDKMYYILLYIGVINTILISIAGLSAAILVLFGKDAKLFYDRILPATFILIGTSVAAGIAMSITKWIVGL